MADGAENKAHIEASIGGLAEVKAGLKDVKKAEEEIAKAAEDAAKKRKKAEDDATRAATESAKKREKDAKDAEKAEEAAHKKRQQGWSDFKGQLRGMGTDALRVTGVLQGISLGKAVGQAHDLNLNATRFATKAGTGVGDLKKNLDGLERRTLTSTPAMLSFAQSMQGLTYDSKYATGSLGDLGDIALSMGESLEQQLDFGSTMRQSLVVTEDVTGEFDRLRGMANSLGLTGGVQAFHDQLVSLGPALEGVSIHTDQSRAKIEAFLAVLGKGLKPGQAQQVQQAALGALKSQHLNLERVLGERVTNDNGELIDPAHTMAKLKAYSLDRKKEAGWNDDEYRQAMEYSFPQGDLGLAIMRYNPEEVEKTAQTAKGTGETKGIADAKRASPEGERIAGELQRDRDLRKAGDKIDTTVGKVQNKLGLSGMLAGQLGLQYGLPLAQKANEAAGGGVKGALAGGAALLAVGAAGYLVGKKLTEDEAGPEGAKPAPAAASGAFKPGAAAPGESPKIEDQTADWWLDTLGMGHKDAATGGGGTGRTDPKVFAAAIGDAVVKALRTSPLQVRPAQNPNASEN